MIIFLGKNHSLYEPLVKESRNDKDIVVSCQYPFRIPKSMIDNYTCVNIHYGVLPWYRGMNPVYWQIKTSNNIGVTLHYVDEGFDTGDIIDYWYAPNSGLTADEAYANLETQGFKLLKKWYKKILTFDTPMIEQKTGKYYKKEDVDFTKNVVADLSVHDKDIRALHFNGKQHPAVIVNGEKYMLVKEKKICTSTVTMA